MTEPLTRRLGIGTRELVSFVGAGGKTTTMQRLGQELATAGNRVVITTTTKMGLDQLDGTPIWTADPLAIDAAIEQRRPVFAARDRSNDKVLGFSPEIVNTLFTTSTVDHVLVEADGARRMLIKAPAEYEPVIPSETTSVVVVMGATALGQEVSSVAHRPERVAALTRRSPDDVLTPEAAATVMLHPDGGLKGIPDAARVVMVIASPPDHTPPEAHILAGMLNGNDRVDRVVLLRPA